MVEHRLIVSLDGVKDTLSIVAHPLPFSVQLGRHPIAEGVKMGPGEFKAQGALIARVKGLEMQAYLTIESFTIVRVRNGRASKPFLNRGAKFSGSAQEMLRSAFSGDFYLFSDVKVKGPGFGSPVLDSSGRVDIE